MPSYTQNIQLPILTVWKHFLYKIEHPEHFVPGVSNVIIRVRNEQNAFFVIREMDITLPDGTTSTIVEKITAQPFLVRFSIIDHPVFEGYVDNIAERISENETKITYSMHWTNKASGETMNNEEIIKNAVLKTIKFMLEE